MTRQELNELRDRLYVLAETVKDVEQDLTDDEADDERRLLNVLLYAAKQATTAQSRAPSQCASNAARPGEAVQRWSASIIGGTPKRSAAAAPPYRR